MLAFRSVTGMNETTFLFRPSTHAVSGELANTRPGGKWWYHHQTSACFTSVWFSTFLFWECRVTLPCRKFSVNFSEIHWVAFTPNLVPKFLSKGEGAPPCSTNTHPKWYSESQTWKLSIYIFKWSYLFGSCYFNKNQCIYRLGIQNICFHNKATANGVVLL